MNEKFKEIKDNLKKEFKEEFKKRSFKIYIISTISLIISLFFFKKNFQILFLSSLIFWIISATFYERSNWKKKDKFDKAYFYFVFTLVSLFTIMFGISFFIFESMLNVAIIMIVFLFGLLLLAILIFQFFSLRNIRTKSLLWIIFNYTLLAFLSILFFGYLFSTASGFETESILNNKGEKINDVENILYFSSVTFYSLGYGDLSPNGSFSKLISQIEVWWGVIIHIIILGHILASLNKFKEENQITKT